MFLALFVAMQLLWNYLLSTRSLAKNQSGGEFFEICRVQSIISVSLRLNTISAPPSDYEVWQ